MLKMLRVRTAGKEREKTSLDFTVLRQNRSQTSFLHQILPKHPGTSPDCLWMYSVLPASQTLLDNSFQTRDRFVHLTQTWTKWNVNISTSPRWKHNVWLWYVQKLAAVLITVHPLRTVNYIARLGINCSPGQLNSEYGRESLMQL